MFIGATEHIAYLGYDLYAAGDGGGPRVQIQHDGRTIADFFAYEESFRGGVRIALDGNRLYAAPGAGGAPVQAVFDLHGVELSRAFIGDPSARDGAWPSPPPLTAFLPIIPHPTLPGSTRAVIDQASLLPRNIADRLTRAGVVVRVYRGNAITALPEFAYLHDLPARGEPGRLYNFVKSVGATSLSPIVTVSDSDAANALHEIGHAVWFWIMSEQQRQDWVALHKATDWGDSYMNGHEEESFAERFVALCQRNEDSSGYFRKNLLASAK